MSKELNKALAEQAGGDERDLQGTQGERDGWGPFPIVQVPWNVFDRAVMWVEDRRRYGDDGTIVDDWKALKTIQRAALAQPSGEVVVTKNESGTIVSVTRQDKEGRVLSVIAESQPSPAQAEQAEAERPEVVARVVHPNPVVLDQCGPLNANDELMTVAQHAASVGRWAEMFNRVEQERDATLARVAELEAKLADLEKQEPIGWFAQYCETPMRRMVQWGTKVPDCAADTFYPLYAAPVAQAQQLHDLDKQCRDDVARALGLRPSQGRGFAWSYLLASIKSCVKAAEDTAQAQHSVPEGWRIERSAERIVVMNLKNGAGYAAARDGESGIAESVLYLLAADLLAAAPGQEGV
ncbi:hypothetical protein AN449_02580 [Pseudomonas aeruginosa]|uniref:hypothetical protein n=1 Tax=Pseudomonas aeruginosa TaxID=287 RepID=UPI0007176DE5|nr:hypothetical protein [Pseudomonas aeruginosa]KRU69639.1 hypothetical protein AN449_02580 [Pseudomonas aeruginosa]VEE75753.1 Uncharacterised protein [Pseudomonas aeruginosa]